MVEDSGRVENFHNGSELSCELKIRRRVVVSNAGRIGPDKHALGSLTGSSPVGRLHGSSKLQAGMLLGRWTNVAWPDNYERAEQPN